MDPNSASSEPRPNEAKTRRRLGGGRLWAALLLPLFFVGIVVSVFLFTHVMQGTCGDLSGLTSEGDDWTIHATEPAALVANPRVRRILEEIVGSPEWRVILGFGDKNSPQDPHELVNQVDALVEEYLDGEIFVAVRWSGRDEVTTGPLADPSTTPRPFESVTVVLRPRSKKLLALARAASAPGIQSAVLSTYVPANAGAEIIDGIVQIANPAALDGQPAAKAPALRGLAATTTRDVIVVGTSFERVNALRARIADLEPFPRPASPDEALVEISNDGIRKFGEAFTDLFGERSTRLVAALHGPLGRERLKIKVVVGDKITLSTSWDGTAWQAAPLPGFEPDGDHLHLAMGPADFCRRVGAGLHDNFDAESICRTKEQLVDQDGARRPTLQSWLTAEKLDALAETLGATKATELAITWRPPVKTSTEDRPIIAVSATTQDDQVLQRALAGLQLESGPVSDLQPVGLPPLAGFHGLEEPHAATGSGRIVVTNGPTTLGIKDTVPQNAQASPALWRFQTSGESLARLLHALDEIRAREITQPVYTRRLALFENFRKLRKDLSLDLDTVIKITDDLFRSFKPEALKKLKNREHAYAGLLKQFNRIHCEGREEEGRTRVEFVLE